MNVKVLFAALSATWALTGCAWGPDQLDARTGKPLPESPTSQREIGLRFHTLNLFGQYRVTHAYLQGVNISQCYPGAPDDDVQFVTMRWDSGKTEPAYVYYPRGNRADRRERPLKFMIEGTKKKNTYFGYDYMQFDKFCGDWTAGGAVTLGIRDKRSQSVQQYIEQEEAWSRRYNADKIARGEAFRSERMPTEQIVRNGNKWVHLHEKSPTAPGMDESETWLLPVGDSNYYFYLSFGYVSGARAANGVEYLKTRALVDQIIDSFKIEKL